MTVAYEPFYREFDSPLMRRIRQEAYGEDIGQHSWVGADELRKDTGHLQLTSSSHLIDLGCGPCGPLTFVLAAVGCTGTGVDSSPAALQVGCARAASLGVASQLFVQAGDLNEPLPFASGSYDAAMSLDVVLHLRDRARLFHEVARVLKPGGRFLLTDAGVLTGSVSSDQVRKRSAHGYTVFAAPGYNERCLQSAGFRVIATEDRTSSVLRNAAGRLAAFRNHRAELEASAGVVNVEEQENYLETVLELSQSASVSRMMYLAEASH